MLSLVALPIVVASVREGLQAIPGHVREASYAVGKTKIATTRRVLLPAARPSVITGAMLGVGRVIGDTAIILLLLGATLTLRQATSTPMLGPLRGTGEHADQLHLLQRSDRRAEPADQGLRGGVRPAADRARAEPRRRRSSQSLAGRRPMELRKPPPVRRLTGNESGAARANGSGASAATATERNGHPSRSSAAAAARADVDRDRPDAGRGPVGLLRRPSRPSSRSRCRSARARCWR